METRLVTLTLDKAKEFYNSGNSALKEIALQVYTEEELTIHEWQNIKTFEDACYELAMYPTVVNQDIRAIERTDIDDSMKKHLIAIYKLDIIRKALNGDWKPSLVQGRIYYPYVRLYPAGQKAREAASINNRKLGESFIADGEKYTLVGGICYCSSYNGLALFGRECGAVRTSRGLLSCKSKEIAEHMSCYFSKEIFEATYAHHIGTYQWI